MTPAKKKEERPSDTNKLRDEIISRLRGAENQPAPEPSPATGGRGAAPGEEGLLSREIRLFGPNVRDMAVFCRQLVMLLDSGIPLLRSLKILSVRTQHPRLKNVVRQVADQVEQGNRFSAALAQHPRVFSPLFINVVKTGEAGGILEGSLKRLAEVLENKASIRRRILAACAYPIAAITVALVILTVVLTVAIPKFVTVYRENNIELPGPTQLVIGLSDFMLTRWWLVLILVAAAIAGWVMFRRTPTGKRFADWCKLRLPILRPINVRIAIARSTRTLGSLVAAGIPLLESLRITAESSENSLVADACRRVHDTVEKGGKLEEQLRHESLVFPPIVTDMIAIGDEAGSLDVMLNKLAETYDEEVDSTLRGLTAIIEPALIVCLGFVVVFIALSLLLPYFNLAKSVTGE